MWYVSIAKPLPDLTGKRISDRIPLKSRERKSFNTLKRMLRDAARKQIQHHRSYKAILTLYVDSSNYAMGAVLTQSDVMGHERPIVFISCKLTKTQQR